MPHGEEECSSFPACREVSGTRSAICFLNLVLLLLGIDGMRPRLGASCDGPGVVLRT